MYLDIRKARIEDINRLVEVINAAYRNQFGRSWTTEKDYVKGARISKQQLISDLNNKNFVGIELNHKRLSVLLENISKIKYS